MSKKLLALTFIATCVLSAFTFLIFMLVRGFNMALLIGFLIGVAVCGICLALMYYTVKLRKIAGLIYGIRVLFMFAGVLVSMFINAVDSLGVILPLIYHLPILAVMALIQDKKETKNN